MSDRNPVARARAIMAINNGYFRSKVLQSAVDLGVFDLLAAGPATAEEIRDRLDLRHRLLREYLDAMVDMGLLEREGVLYRNSADAAEFLVSTSPTYLGGTASQHARLHYHAWGRLADSLRDGHAKSDVRPEGGTQAFVEFYEDAERARRLMQHVDAHNTFMADELVRHFDWSGHRTFTDIGGARGNLAARIVMANPHLRANVVDLPALEPLFDELMATLGVADKVTFHGGDFFARPLPVTDVVVIGHVLPDWPEAERTDIVKRCYDAVRPGGTLIVYDALVDENLNDHDTLLRRLNSTMIRDDHQPFSVEECHELLKEHGFQPERCFVSDTIAHDHVLIAHKPE
ncbi:methyltransferase [Actinokineospora fastidiosa]|uniref:O-methyltransferase n=1 Tax=Actinokineospora fastidiosa TaxID=1816 RepID=A0A918GN88_9PSEU|nr:methyltransferase [Actinokineospora fastidiosa]GGS46790.1 O-methyltransferase [Actinokineospora fastidiosa]